MRPLVAAKAHLRQPPLSTVVSAPNRMLNRGAVIIRPRQPYIDWANGLDDSDLVPTPEGEHTVYLIPAYENDDQAMLILSTCYQAIFEAELLGWHTDESDWPNDRSFILFQEWFSIELHSVVEDLCGYPFEDDTEWE